MKNDKLLVEILSNQVRPSLGCTEPGAVAYAVSRAKELLDSDIEELTVCVDKNVLKNGLVVGIPGTSETGIIFASALALVIGKSEYSLEALKDVSDKDIEKAIEIMDQDIIKLNLDDEIQGLYICVDAIGKGEKSRVVIKNTHTNIVFESKDDLVLFNEDTVEMKESGEIRDKIRKFSLDELIDFTNNIDISKIEFIQDGIDMNLKIAKVGINDELNLEIGLGKYLYNEADDLYSMAKAYTAAASEARMSGYLMPVMSSAGSGNHGLVSIIPIAYIGKEMKLEREKILRSITLSHLMTIYIKSYIGSLSPVCGCGVAAGVGFAAGLTYMRDGTYEQIKGSIKNMLAGISGMICDGAKIGCAYKLSISTDAAIDASDMALANIFIPSDNGILAETAEKTIENLSTISNVGMQKTDNVILEVMLQNNK